LQRAQLAALERAIANVDLFHAAPHCSALAGTGSTMPGVQCERLIRPITAVGLYAPAGSAPLPSSVIMLAVPARLAGCATRVLCTPPDRQGRAHSAILVAAQLCGVEHEIFKIGGAQAIAALAYGTASVPKVDKIFGPGNVWVTAAKQAVAGDPHGAACDLPAGPSEVLIVADDSAPAEIIAADLLAQAEHDPGSQAILVTASENSPGGSQLASMRSGRLYRVAEFCSSRSSRAAAFWSRISRRHSPSRTTTRPNICFSRYASPRQWLNAVESAGSVFLGPWSPEVLGDYCTGANHVLPTYGYARAYSGLSLIDFVKRITVQELSAEGLRALGPTAVTLARLEGLDGHADSVTRRLQILARTAAAGAAMAL
jgi:histidinol dehydrogenase